METSSTTAEQTWFVIPSRDVFVAHIEITGAPEDSTLLWYADFDPCTRIVPQVPMLDGILGSLNDFAAYIDVDSGIAIHFRPEAPGTDDWRRARSIAGESGELTAWDKLRGGTWIGYQPVQGISSFSCGPDAGPGSVLEQADAGRLSSARAAVGHVASAVMVKRTIEIDHLVGTVFVAFGANRKAVDEGLAYARSRGYEALVAETRAYWKTKLESCALPTKADEGLKETLRCCLETVLMATDAQSGAVVRSPISKPPLGFDFPRQSVWIDQAFATAGLGANYDAHLGFLERSIVRDPVNRPYSPVGSIPIALYADGTPGFPTFLLDLQATGWYLYGVERHADFLSGESRTTFLKAHWKPVDQVATFLTSWFGEAYAHPVPGFDPERLRDFESSDDIIAVAAGMRAAVSIARSLGENRPDWNARLGELENRVQVCAFGPTGEWKIVQPLSLWPTGIVPSGDPRWGPILEKLPRDLEAMDSGNALKALWQAAMLWQNEPDTRVVLIPLLEPTLKRAANDYPGDAYYAALAYLTAMALLPKT